MIKKCKQLEFEFAKDYDDPIQNKDCIEYLKDLPNNSVDLVLTDPPYSIGYQGEKWDKQWPNELSYLGWCQEWTELCAKKLKPNRMMVIWGTLKTKVFMKYDLKVLEKISQLSELPSIGLSQRTPIRVLHRRYTYPHHWRN